MTKLKSSLVAAAMLTGLAPALAQTHWWVLTPPNSRGVRECDGEYGLRSPAHQYEFLLSVPSEYQNPKIEEVRGGEVLVSWSQYGRMMMGIRFFRTREGCQDAAAKAKETADREQAALKAALDKKLEQFR
jgi:hypothetical protein